MTGIQINFSNPSLEFPVLEEDKIVRLSAYHTPDWGETGVFHNGIDLVISDNVTIISPVSGIIVAYSENINPYAGNVLFKIAIAINLAWEVQLVLEPGFLDETNNSFQSDLIVTSIGNRVSPGDELATLLASENYPHLHYMLLYLGTDVCAYNYSAPTARTTFENIAMNSNSTILYPYPQLNPLLAPVSIVFLGGTIIYIIFVIVVFRRKK